MEIFQIIAVCLLPFLILYMFIVACRPPLTEEDVKKRKKRTMWDDDSIWKDDIHTDIGYNSIPGNIHHSDNDM